jgi:hypothetical protein
MRCRAYAKDSKDGKERTLVKIGFCPGGGKAAASPGAVKMLELNTNPREERDGGSADGASIRRRLSRSRSMTGSVEPGGALSGPPRRQARHVGVDDRVSTWRSPRRIPPAGLVCK